MHMSYIPITPFRRAADYTPVKPAHQTPPEPLDKWHVLRQVTAARAHFGLSDRGIAVLQVLLGFYPERQLEPGAETLVVYPSNAAICERLGGMACSTMRRHLATLVETGLVARRDSPNGKRFMRRYSRDREAFGFDLTPLLTRAEEIGAKAALATEAKERHERLRRTVSLMRRDLAALAAFGLLHHPDSANWDALDDQAILAARSLRRKLSEAELTLLQAELKTALAMAKAGIDLPETANPSTSDAVNEQHIQKTEKDYVAREEIVEEPDTLPLQMVLSACPEIQRYVPDRIRHWHELVSAAETVGPMMGIAQPAWRRAVDAMGHPHAAVVIAAMLERFEKIRSAGGYLGSLTARYEKGQFSPNSMIAALCASSRVACSQL